MRVSEILADVCMVHGACSVPFLDSLYIACVCEDVPEYFFPREHDLLKAWMGNRAELLGQIP